MAATTPNSLSLTMNTITPFSFEGFAIRTIQIDGAPWFVAADVCGVLDLGNVTMALKRLDADEQALISIEGLNYKIALFGNSGQLTP